jgi:outer membrane protein
MKKLFLLLGFTLLFTGLQAQKIAVVDIAKVLDNMEEYKAAQGQLDKLAEDWRQEIAKDYDRIKSMYNKYQAEQVLLGEEARKQREDEIMDAEAQVREKQKDKFGPDGELFTRRKQLVQPLQDRVYNAIEAYALEKNYDVIMDKSSASGLIFTKDALDKTEDIIKKVGN